MAEISMEGKRISGNASLELGFTEAVPEEMRYGIRELKSLFVAPDKRKKGDATALMYQVCYEADRKGIVLFLEPVADGGMPQKKLEKFYKGFGFIELQHKPLLMARQAHGR